MPTEHKGSATYYLTVVAVIIFTATIVFISNPGKHLYAYVTFSSSLGFLNGSLRISFMRDILEDLFVYYEDDDKFYSKSNIRKVNSSLSLIEVVTKSDKFLQRVEEYNVALDRLRRHLLHKMKNKTWTHPTNADFIFLESKHDFLDKIANRSEENLKTLVLPWLGRRFSGWNSLEDSSNLYSGQTYGWAANKLLCDWIAGKINMKADFFYNNSCTTDVEKALPRTGFYPLFINAKYWDFGHAVWANQDVSFPYYATTAPPPFVTYVHILQDAVIVGTGEGYTSNVKVVPYCCGPGKGSGVPQMSKTAAIYDEVFVITHPYSHAFFHRMGESFPRLGIFVEFLRKNRQIRILCRTNSGHDKNLLGILGIDPGRIITGDIRARIAYIPRGTSCQTILVQETQMLSKYYREYIEQNMKTEPRNKLILIERTSGEREFPERQKIEQALRNISDQYGLVFRKFSDKAIPTFNDTMILFHSAKLVVAPHGAGLSNLLFSQPSTYVIESVCNPEYINLCFLRLSLALGHHWHGIPSAGGCITKMNVTTEEIVNTVQKYLRKNDNTASTG